MLLDNLSRKEVFKYLEGVRKARRKMNKIEGRRFKRLRIDEIECDKTREIVATHYCYKLLLNLQNEDEIKTLQKTLKETFEKPQKIKRHKHL